MSAAHGGDESLLLYAEDSESDQFLLSRIWSNITGDKPVCVQDGVRLMEYLEGCVDGANAWPRLILLDLNMPRMNGFEVLEKIKQDPRFARLPVVVLSTSDQPEDVDACFERHANGYLVKEFSPDELKRTLSAAHEFWFRWAVRPDVGVPETPGD